MTSATRDIIARLGNPDVRGDGATRYMQIAPGDRLPPERDLAADLKVSRDTLRQALTELQRHGRVERSVGRGGGTFVAEPKYERSVRRTSAKGYAGLADQLREQSIASGASVLLAQARSASPAVAAALQIGPGSTVYELHRVRTANSRPVALERTAYPAQRLPGLLEHPVDGSMYRLLRDIYGRNPDRALEYLEPILAGATEAEALEVTEGAPLMYIERVVYDEQDVPIEFSRDVFRGDRTRIVVVGHGVETTVLANR